MKHTKKLLALVLAMLMAFSLLAVTAAAADAEEHEHTCAACCEDEGIMPIGEAGFCPYCGWPAEYSRKPENGKYHFVCLNPTSCGRSGWI